MTKQNSRTVRIRHRSWQQLKRMSKITNKTCIAFLEDILENLDCVIGNFTKASYFYVADEEKNRLTFYAGGRRIPAKVVSGAIGDVPINTPDSECDEMVRTIVEPLLNKDVKKEK